MLHPHRVILAVVLLESTVFCRAQDAPAASELAKVRVLGCANCAGPESFSAVSALNLDAQDRVLIADPSAPMIRIFKLDDRAVVAFARAGRGPGELLYPLHVSARVDGHLQVVDIGNQRLTIFNADGGFVTSIPLRGFPTGAGFHPAAGILYLVTTNVVHTSVQRWTAGDSTLTIVIPVLGAFPPAEPGHPPSVHPAAAPDGSFALGDGTSEYRIRVFAPSGAPLYDVTRALKPQRKTESELATERQAAEGRMARMGPGARPVGPYGAGSVSPFKPFFDRYDALAFDDAGRLWVRTTRGEDYQTVFDLFGRKGEFLRELVVDEAVRTFAIRGGYLAAVTEGELETPTVTVWRLNER